MATVRKITTGDVVQEFDENGNFIGQHFIAGDQCEVEVEDAESPEEQVELTKKGYEFYHPFEFCACGLETKEE